MFTDENNDLNVNTELVQRIRQIFKSKWMLMLAVAFGAILIVSLNDIVFGNVFYCII